MPRDSKLVHGPDTGNGINKKKKQMKKRKKDGMKKSGRLEMLMKKAHIFARKVNRDVLVGSTFLKVLKEFNRGALKPHEMVRSMKTLFRNDENMLKEFRQFCPATIKICLPSEERYANRYRPNSLLPNPHLF